MAGSRVLVLVENLSVPFDRRVWQESRALAAAGYDVSVVCPRGERHDTEAYAELEGVRIHRFPLRPATGGPLGYGREYGAALLRMMVLGLRLGRFEVVHICNPPDLLFLAALPHKLAGARIVFDHHDLVPELYLSRFDRGPGPVHRALLALERITFRLADVVIATNGTYRAAALSRGGKSPEQVFVVRSGPRLDRFVPVPPDPSLKRGKSNLLCYLGVMGPQDGVDYALRALSCLRDELDRRDWHAVFVGSGDEYPSLVVLAHELGLTDDVTFTGRVSDDDVLRHLSSADVCLSPDPLNPLNDASTMNKIMEYMAMSKPIVSFDLREARVSAAQAAVYAQPNDERDFAERIAGLLDDPGARERMGREGRRRVETTLSWDHSERALLECYGQVSRKGEGPRSPGSGAQRLRTRWYMRRRRGRVQRR